ncbi:glycosyltransferase [Streptomyces catenulae]|uniref:Glycosyltransferase n=1 Tax=Streptomyces catenulae TaxID=66875 RepID=A0ABV2YYR2_9ACTN|nr:glycosyltransferase [Streptomyces catenulae]
MTTLQISVVVPCFNEAAVIETFHTALVTTLGHTGEPFEICYVDDGSADGTGALLRALAAADPRVRYTFFSRNFGKEAAMLAGLRMSRGRAVVLMDADLQHPPELIPRMVALQRHGYDQVVPRRDRAGDALARTALSRTYYALVRRFMDVELVDGAGDFRLLSRRAVDTVLSLPENNRFSKGIFSWIGFETVTFRYRNAERAAGCSKWGSRRLLNYGIDGLLSFNNRPLRLAIYGGLWVFLSALAYALWVVANVALNGANVPGYATLLTAIVALSGIQLVTLGVIGEYVGRIYHEAKRRPPYVVRETDAAPATDPVPGPVPVTAATGPEPAPRPARQLPRLPRQLAVFVLIGFANTAVYLAVYAALNRTVPYLAAHVLGYAVSTVGSFLLNSRFTCRTRPTWRGLVRYPLSSVFNLVASGALLYLAVSRFGMDRNLAALGAGVLVTPVTFLLARWAITSGGAASAPPRRTAAPLGRPADRPEAG